MQFLEIILYIASIGAGFAIAVGALIGILALAERAFD